ncbi:hypothetical protein [Qipengyuania sp. ASV99]|uniref:hypothetical protein n=1 Tax=Qipengyuania sp. ASV99 TaxID=3399681 RepID=UPI003A4C685B
MFAALRLRSEVLLALGRIDDAEREILGTISQQSRVLNPDHPQTQVSELVWLEILAAKGERDTALAEIGRVHDALLAATGPGHIRVKQAARLRDRLLGSPPADE